jgi:drug/metabolite transporter (DMT)-like permease
MFQKLRKSDSFAWIALLFGVVCIGFSAIFVKLADVPGSVSTFYRLLFASAAILPLWMWKGMKIPGRSDLGLILIGASFFALDLFLWNTAILMTTAATATLLANNAPLWVGLISFLIFREKLGRKFWIGLAIALAGLNVLVGLEVWSGMQMNRGDLLSLVAGFFYALYILYTMEVRKRVDTVTFMTFSAVMMTLLLLVVNIISGNPFTGFTTSTWLALAGMGLISHFGGWLAINYALGHLKGANVSVTLLSQAVVTAIMGIFILGEHLSVHEITGGLLVLAGIYVVNRRKPGEAKIPGAPAKRE